MGTVRHFGSDVPQSLYGESPLSRTSQPPNDQPDLLARVFYFKNTGDGTGVAARRSDWHARSVRLHHCVSDARFASDASGAFDQRMPGELSDPEAKRVELPTAPGDTDAGYCREVLFIVQEQETV